MRASGSYISFEDHSAVVGECRRLLDELKGKYEESRAEMGAELSDLRVRFQRVRHERDSWKLQHKTLAGRLSWNEKRMARLESERRNALDCLEDLLGYAERLEHRAEGSERHQSRSLMYHRKKKTNPSSTTGLHRPGKKKRTRKKEKTIRTLRSQVAAQRRIIDKLTRRNRQLEEYVRQMSLTDS